MKTGYKRLICTLCAVSAAICMTSAPVQAEVCADKGAEGYYFSADRLADAIEPAMLANDSGDENKKESAVSTVKEQAKSRWQIYACIGGGVLVIFAVISLLAENMRKK